MQYICTCCYCLFGELEFGVKTYDNGECEECCPVCGATLGIWELMEWECSL